MHKEQSTGLRKVTYWRPGDGDARQALQHECYTQNRCNGVGNAFAGDVGRTVRYNVVTNVADVEKQRDMQNGNGTRTDRQGEGKGQEKGGRTFKTLIENMTEIKDPMN